MACLSETLTQPYMLSETVEHNSMILFIVQTIPNPAKALKCDLVSWNTVVHFCELNQGKRVPGSCRGAVGNPVSLGPLPL